MNKNSDEISKDISAFANSDGGLIIYGIVEEGQLAQHIDEGLSNTDRNHKEWLENKVTSNVAPRLQGLRISEIALGTGKFIYAMSVPASDRGPHQDRKSHRYYKRHNFKCEPMEDYEIRDVRNRLQVLPPLLSVRIDVSQGSMLQLCVENIGDLPASDVEFSFSTPLKWEHGEPKALTEGIKSLAPRRRLAFFYGVGHWLGSNRIIEEFSVDVSYFHPAVGKRLIDRFDVDLQSMSNSLQEYTDLERHAQKLEKALGATTKILEKISKSLMSLETVAGPTGLDLSYSSMQGIAVMLGAEHKLIQKIDPTTCQWQVFQEVLALDIDMAIRLQRFFAWPNENQKLESLDGMTEELLFRIKVNFHINEDRQPPTTPSTDTALTKPKPIE